MHPQAAGAHHAGTEFAAAPLGSERTDASEYLTPQQYRLMVQETDQARDDAMAAQNLADSARVRAAAVEASATRSEQGRREMIERLRDLKLLVCGVPRSATHSRQEQGLWSTRRQRRQRGGSDYCRPRILSLRRRNRRRNVRLEAPNVKRRVKSHSGRNV
ncbi:hypothetical protein PR001_g11559 [Phytophthora rubi]|uniref:Uncharacterized protein n=1 Tax=Phytophthora rubi TaxID=129364 RepID=A0A6A3LY21_9STRA|nr:hypothetical protein PR002_g11806 [Phytophthora rubi]KAE9029185.1 hypothetical protein PR001_g11559 [Phytophthora rubi]